MSFGVIDQIAFFNKYWNKSADYAKGDNAAWISKNICPWYFMHVHSLHVYYYFLFFFFFFNENRKSLNLTILTN